jgi:hypothetical protein
MRLTAQQIASLWVQYGGDPTTAPLAAAIALAESSGDPNAYNGRDPNGGSFGLFQINGIHGAAATYDLATNIRYAISLSSNGTDWSPWGAYTNGSYQRYLPSDLAVNQGTDPGSTDVSVPAGISSSTAISIFFIGAAAIALWIVS